MPTGGIDGVPHLIALGRDSERWNWFLAADYLGSWIVCDGWADVVLTQTSMDAVLYIASDLPPYLTLSAPVAAGKIAEATVLSPGEGRPPAFNLSGKVYFGGETPVGQSRSILLTDGTTVLGLAFGPKSVEPRP